MLKRSVTHCVNLYFGSIVFHTLFGASTTFWMGLISRFLLGSFNGMLGTVKVGTFNGYDRRNKNVSRRIVFPDTIYPGTCQPNVSRASHLFEIPCWNLSFSVVWQAYASEVCSERHQAISVSIVRSLLTVVSIWMNLYLMLTGAIFLQEKCFQNVASLSLLVKRSLNDVSNVGCYFY